MAERAEDTKEIEPTTSSEPTVVKNKDDNTTMSAEAEPAVSPTMSKNQLKKKRKWEKAMEIKRR